MVKCPCKGCENRHSGCHGKCEAYAEFRVNHEAAKMQNAEDRKLGKYYIERKKRLEKKYVHHYRYD